MSRRTRAAPGAGARKAAEKKETPVVVENKLTPFIPSFNGKLTVEELIKCLPLQITEKHGEEIKKLSVEEAEKFIEEKLDEMFSDEKVDESFWLESPDDLPIDKDMKEYGEELDKMRLQDELDDLMTQIDKLCLDKLFTTISSKKAGDIVKKYNALNVNPNFDYSNKTGILERKTPYQLSELHVMTISKKVQFGSNDDDNARKLVEFLDKYHETSVVEDNQQ